VATEVSICNQALAYLGENRILTLDDDSRQAGACKDAYTPARDALLEEMVPQFARANARLIAETTTPSAWYTHSYPLPPDCINVWWCGPGDVSQFQFEAWERVGSRVQARVTRSESGAAFIWYTRRVEDASRFSATFADMLASRLAAELAYPLTESVQRHQVAWQVFKQKALVHSGSDGQQGRTRRTFNRDLTGRRGGAGFGYFVTGVY